MPLVRSLLFAACSFSEPSLLWMAPIGTGGGYSSEAIAFLAALHEVPGFGVRNFAEQMDREFLGGLPPKLEKALQKALRIHDRDTFDVVVCHSPPDAWVPSAFAGWDRIAPCPPGAVRRRPSGAVHIGRTMYESDRVPKGWLPRLAKMDEIWVPTEFLKAAWGRQGVDPRKLVVVPEPIDTDFFHPGAKPFSFERPGKVNFLSVFKWERRKGWDVLVRAFLEEFPEPNS